ncbi:MAG: Holliday junction branch migration protein RuvA [Candidatus Margulisbacteria bacterium]|nr:Holliday junction branch migration protein RuvA [Candidatus Margulisiibacteriota bacterium]
MIAHIQGILDNIVKNAVIIDVNGIGYKVFVSSSIIDYLPNVGEQIKLFTHMVVKEDDQSLYGFKSKEEKNLFTQIISVSGIGPKTGLVLMSQAPVNQLVAAITQGNVDLIKSTPGIGLKTAQRLIIELKEKLAKEFGVKPAEVCVGLSGDQGVVQDAISALMTLGYKPSEARNMISKMEISSDTKVEEVIKQVLRGE